MKWLKKILVHTYVPMAIAGMFCTLYHFLFVRRFTLQYPEQKLPIRPGYRGEHRLKKDAEGRPKCVACLMCQTACPAKCIKIEATDSPWADREKVPKSFVIDMLRCIYCGMCEEACPCDAIELTPRYTVVATSRQDKVYDLVKLLNNEYDV